MVAVAIHGWREETAELVQALAGALGLTAYEARQRLAGGGPSVVACFADPELARTLARKLRDAGMPALVVDAAAVRMRAGYRIARRFELGERSMNVDTLEGQREEILYGDVELMIAGTAVVGSTETRTVVERKISLGKTLLAGGLPMSAKVERQEQVSNEERGKVLYLHAGGRPPVVFSQNGMAYDGFGPEMKLSRELNFNHLLSRLRLLIPHAVYDDRLLNRATQIRLLGPAPNPESNLDLAAAILAGTLFPESPALRCRTTAD